MNRRRVLAGMGALAVAGPAGAAEPRRIKPQVGDVLVHAFGDRAGTILAVDETGARPLAAFAMDVASGVVRDGSLNNQLLALRIDASALSARAARYAVADVSATGSKAVLVYSAACTHTGCEVNGWQESAGHLVCPCHGSEFDVADAARVVNGPAPRPLAMLRVALEDGVLQVAGGFSRRVGPEPP